MTDCETNEKKLFVAVSVDKNSVLGKIATIGDLNEQLRREIRDLERAILFEEKKPADS